MDCTYCGTSNTPDEHRCQRCGRRLDTTSPYSRQAYGRGATARALQYEAHDRKDLGQETGLSPDSSKRSTPFQPSLFQTRVVSFESYAPEAVETPRKTRTLARPKPRHKRPIPGQESFAFESYETVITQAAPTARAAEPVIGCSAGVAHPLHRLLASAWDLSMVIIAMALFLTVFYLAGGQVVFSVHTAALYVGLGVIFYLLYHLLWCMADTDSAGMRWAQLTLVNFDGGQPDREQRLVRLASGGLSVLAAGLGLLWALVDEESLTWHDHISKTFPTPSQS